MCTCIPNRPRSPRPAIHAIPSGEPWAPRRRSPGTPTGLQPRSLSPVARRSKGYGGHGVSRPWQCSGPIGWPPFPSMICAESSPRGVAALELERRGGEGQSLHLPHVCLLNGDILHISRGRTGICQHGAFSGIAVIVASFVPAECPKGGGYLGYIRKALEKGYLEHPGSACCTDDMFEIFEAQRFLGCVQVAGRCI